MYCGFIEVWSVDNVVRFSRRPIEISRLNEVITHTNISNSLKTIAIFKIKLK